MAAPPSKHAQIRNCLLARIFIRRNCEKPAGSTAAEEPSHVRASWHRKCRAVSEELVTLAATGYVGSD